jgi:hypothetical protein
VSIFRELRVYLYSEQFFAVRLLTMAPTRPPRLVVPSTSDQHEADINAHAQSCCIIVAADDLLSPLHSHWQARQSGTLLSSASEARSTASPSGEAVPTAAKLARAMRRRSDFMAWTMQKATQKFQSRRAGAAPLAVNLSPRCDAHCTTLSHAVSSSSLRSSNDCKFADKESVANGAAAHDGSDGWSTK